jgi:serine/threonine protein kinase
MTAESLCNLLALMKLFSPESARTLLLRWRSAARDPADGRAFAEWLVAGRWVTEYQAGLLLRGHREGYFLGSYRILDRIGKGRMAGVYKAIDPRGQVFALKVLPPSKAVDSGAFRRFRREAHLAIRLRHPSIVRTYGLGRMNDVHFIVMEFLEGETLQAILAERTTLPPIEAARIGFLAALGLDHLHEHDFVHRDLSPGNLMLLPAPAEGQNTLRSMVKILDIGLGRQLFDPASTEPTQGLTNEEDILGSRDYLAPEQARDARKADIRSDIYSLGCTVYHALAGQPPFPDKNLVRQILRHAHEQPVPLPEVNPQVPEALDAIIATMLAKEPAQRYQTPADLAKVLRSFLASQSPKRVQPESP